MEPLSTYIQSLKHCITIEKRSYHNFTGEFRGRKNMKMKFREANVLEATDIQSENWWIK